MMKALKVKKQILASQISTARSRNNERQLQKEISDFFKQIMEEVQTNLQEYWSDYQLLQGQINLITQPILEHHNEYYNLLIKYNLQEFELGYKEGERLVQLSRDKASMKAFRIPRFLRKATRITKDRLFDTIPSVREDLKERVYITSQSTLARLTGQLNEIITKGYTEGKGINVVASMITKREKQLQTWEAKRIARTEIHNAHNRGVMQIYKDLDVEYTQWKAADDDRTRESHAEINGEIIPMGEKYSNGLEYPGDESGDIEEWINCRCSNAPFVIPYGYMAPSFSPFREEDLIKIK